MAESPFHVDGIILGAGIAGLSTADALLQKGCSCVVLDSQKPASGSSGSPGMLVNPATGRRAKKAWKADKCFSLISDLLKKVQTETEQPFYEQNGIVRPALTRKLADNFKRSPEKYDWPAGWIQWLAKEAFSEQYPAFEHHFGGLFVKNAMTVNGSEFIKAFAGYLAGRNVKMEFGHEYRLEQTQERWIAETKDGLIYNADFVVDATGYNQVYSGYWNFLPLHPIKGQSATFFFDEPLPFGYSVSGLGYMAFFKNQPTQITVGSTYEHEFDHLEPDEDGLNYLRKKLDSTFPGLSEKSSSVKQWAGVRVSVQDKKPVIGAHPEKKGLYIIGAFGSKGLLVGRLIAGILAESILERTKIESAVNITRF